MPVDLLRGLHRAVFIKGCAEAYRDDLIEKLHRRCGKIDEWDMENDMIVVVFDKRDAAALALSFSGFEMGMATPLDVRPASMTIDGETVTGSIRNATTMGEGEGRVLMIAAGRSTASTADEDARRRAREEKLKALSAAVVAKAQEESKALGVDFSARFDALSALEREKEVLSCTRRQLHALIPLTADAIRTLRGEWELLEAQNQAATVMLEKLQSEAIDARPKRSREGEPQPHSR